MKKTKKLSIGLSLFAIVLCIIGLILEYINNGRFYTTIFIILLTNVTILFSNLFDKK